MTLIEKQQYVLDYIYRTNCGIISVKHNSNEFKDLEYAITANILQKLEDENYIQKLSLIPEGATFFQTTDGALFHEAGGYIQEKEDGEPKSWIQEHYTKAIIIPLIVFGLSILGYYIKVQIDREQRQTTREETFQLIKQSIQSNLESRR